MFTVVPRKHLIRWAERRLSSIEVHGVFTIVSFLEADIVYNYILYTVNCGCLWTTTDHSLWKLCHLLDFGLHLLLTHLI